MANLHDAYGEAIDALVEFNRKADRFVGPRLADCVKWNTPVPADAEAAMLRIEVESLRAQLADAVAGWRAAIATGDEMLAEIRSLRADLAAATDPNQSKSDPPKDIDWAKMWGGFIPKPEPEKPADPRSEALERGLRADKGLDAYGRRP